MSKESKELPIGTKVKVRPSYDGRNTGKKLCGSVAVIIGPIHHYDDDPDEDMYPIQNSLCPWEVKKDSRWNLVTNTGRFCRVGAKYLEVVGDEKTCVSCLTSRTRLDSTTKNMADDHLCLSCV